MATEIAFTVYGVAQPAGSKRALPMRGQKGARPIIVDANRKAAPWKQEVASAARQAYHGPLLDGPLEVWFSFYMPRPLGHFGSGKNARNVKASSPGAPIVAPDALKLSRAVEDALQGVIYRNDSQIVEERLSKRYGEPARVEVEIRALTLTAEGVKR